MFKMTSLFYHLMMVVAQQSFWKMHPRTLEWVQCNIDKTEDLSTMTYIPTQYGNWSIFTLEVTCSRVRLIPEDPLVFVPVI